MKFFEYLDNAGGFYYEVRLHKNALLKSRFHSFSSVGAMHLCIVLELLFLLTKTKYISSRI